MKLIIDIPKDIIESAKSNPNYYPTYHFEKIWRAIAKGIPLPKGHGDLIDRKDLTPDADYEDGIFGAVSCQQIIEAEAIIEADTAESEDRCKNCEYSHNPDYTRCHECKAESEDNT